MGGYIGLDYQGVDVVFRMHDVEDRKERFSDIQIMERAALEVLNKSD